MPKSTLVSSLSASVAEAVEVVFIELLLYTWTAPLAELYLTANGTHSFWNARLFAEVTFAPLYTFVLVIQRFPVPPTLVAAKIPSSGAHVIPVQKLSTALERVVQVMPSGLVITLFPLPVDEMAANNLNSGAHVTLYQLLLFVERVVQFIPSGDVMTRLLDPVNPTATKSES